MWSLVKWAVVIGAVAAVLAFVPVGGRTALERWRAAPTAKAFAERTWSEIRRATGMEPGRRPASRSAPHPAARAAAPARPPRTAPVERHTDADRQAVDALVAEHAR